MEHLNREIASGRLEIRVDLSVRLTRAEKGYQSAAKSQETSSPPTKDGWEAEASE